MSWHFSQALVAAYSADTSSGGAPCAPLSWSRTHALFCAPDRMKAFSRLSRFGTTCEPLTDDLGAGVLTWCLADSLAKTSAQPAKAQESTESAAECGRTWPESFARWDRDTLSWRTPQCSLLEGLDEFSETWPQWGMMRAGECSVLPTSVPSTNESESGLLPTPTAHNSKEGNYPSEANRHTPLLATHAGGKINPAWTEHLMGWPLGWTDLKPLETDRFQAWRRSHGEF